MKDSRRAVSRYVADGDPLKLIVCFMFIGIIVISIISAIIAVSAQKPDIRAAGSDSNRSLLNESYTIGVQAYIYGLAPVIMQRTEHAMTTIQGPGSAPVNHFGHVRHLGTPNDTIIVTPNTDTLYSSAWLELDDGPMVLHVPNTRGRYYVMQMLDAYTNTFATIGKRTTGTKEGDYVIVGPDWNGTLPANVREIQSPTNTVWIIGRILVNGTDDVANVTALQDKLKLTPLSQYGKPENEITLPAPPARSQPSTSVQDRLKFFEELRVALKNNPPPKGEDALMAVFSRIGLGMNKTPYGGDLDPEAAAGLAQAIPAGDQIVSDVWKDLKGNDVNGWAFMTDIGTYGYDYLTRAAVAVGGLGANVPQESVYPKAQTDSDGKQLSGTGKYLIHFPAGKLPPVDAFWSLTVYNATNYMLVPNLIDRYAIGDRTKGLKYNEDGSLDIYIQHDPPIEKSNWLPTPNGDFYLIMRMYQPKPEVLNGIYHLPPVKKVT